jgi:hypothetical protein
MFARRSYPCALAAARASPRSSKGCEPMTNRKAKQKQESREPIQASAAALLPERGIKGLPRERCERRAESRVKNFEHFQQHKYKSFPEYLFVEVERS